MLQLIRDYAQGVVAWILLILISIPFALWGIQNYFDTGKEAAVATVGDREFFQRDINRAYEQNLANLVGIDQYNEEELKQQALDKLIREEVLAQATEADGLLVSDQAVREFIQSLPYFQVDGKFDQNQYKSMLSAQGLSSAQFVEQARRAMQMDQYQRGVKGSTFVAATEVDRFFRILNEVRDLDYVIVPLAKEPEKPIEDAAIEAYYQQNAAAFMTDERVTVDYLELSVDSLASAETPSEDALKAYYEEQISRYTTPERRKVSHILFEIGEDSTPEAAIEKAKAVKARLEKGESFAALAKELSADTVSAQQGGDLGLINRGEMDPVFEEAAYALAKGAISEPVQSAFGIHLITVTELQPGSVKPLDQVRAELTQAYQKNAAENRFFQLAETLAEVSYEHPESLQPAADALGLKIQQSDWFSRDSGEGIGAEEAVRKAAFSQDVLAGNNSEPVEIGADKAIVLRVREHQPAEPLPLDSVREEIVMKLRDEAIRSTALAKAEAIYRKLQQGESLAALAQAEGLELKEARSVARSDNELPWELKRALFQAAKPEGERPTPLKVALSDGRQVTGILFRTVPGKPEDVKEKEREMARTNLEADYGRGLFQSFISYLEESADVSIRNKPE